MGPDIKAAFWRCDAHAEGAEGLHYPVAAVLVNGVVLGNAVLRSFEGGDCHALDGLGDAGVDVVFDAGEGVDEGRVADGPTDTPTGHVEALGKGVKLDADVARAIGL